MYLPLIKKYFIKKYLRTLLLTSLFTFILIYILDFTEVLRVFSLNKNTDFFQMIIATSIKTIDNFVYIMPLIVLIGTMVTFIMLSKKNELVIFSSLGISHTFFLKSIFIFVILLFLFIITIILPFQQYLIHYQADHQITNNYVFFKNDSHTFIEIDNIDKELFDVTIWILNNDNFNLERTMYTNKGQKHNNNLILNDITVMEKDNTFNISTMKIILNDAFEEYYNIQNKNLNLFEFPNFINILKRLKISCLYYEQYFWKKITMIFNLISMSYLSFISSFSIINRHKYNMLYGCLIGILMFFLNDIIISLMPYDIMTATLLVRLSILSMIIGYALCIARIMY